MTGNLVGCVVGHYYKQAETGVFHCCYNCISLCGHMRTNTARRRGVPLAPTAPASAKTNRAVRVGHAASSESKRTTVLIRTGFVTLTRKQAAKRHKPPICPPLPNRPARTVAWRSMRSAWALSSAFILSSRALRVARSRSISSVGRWVGGSRPRSRWTADDRSANTRKRTRLGALTTHPNMRRVALGVGPRARSWCAPSPARGWSEGEGGAAHAERATDRTREGACRSGTDRPGSRGQARPTLHRHYWAGHCSPHFTVKVGLDSNTQVQ